MATREPGGEATDWAQARLQTTQSRQPTIARQCRIRCFEVADTASEDYWKGARRDLFVRTLTAGEVLTVAGSDDVYIKTAGDALRHRAPLMLAIVLVSLLLGGYLSRSAAPVYQAEATLLVDVSKQGLSGVFTDGVLTRYYLHQATSPEVLRRAGAAAGGESPAVIGGAVTVTPINGANIIRIRAQSSRRETATLRANAVAHAMIDQNRADAAGRLYDSRAYLGAELARLDVALHQPGRSLSELETLRGQYLTTYGRLQDLNLEQARTSDGLTVLQAARSAERQAGNGPRYLAAALLLGLFLAGLVGLLLERFDDRLWRPDGLAQAAGVRTVLCVDGFWKVHGPRSGELYRLGFAQIAAAYPDARALVVVAASRRESDAAALVGRGLAAAAGRGYATLIRLDVLDGSGSHASQSIHELGSSIEEARRSGTAVVTVSSPLGLPSAAAFASSADVAIMVAAAGRTRFQEVRNAAHALRQLGIEPVAGVLLSGRGKPRRLPWARKSA